MLGNRGHHRFGIMDIDGALEFLAVMARKIHHS
jgi:hypothetical protein